ncbi:disulfide bond formation protein DsbA [Chitinophaga caeni]|uniref:Disulfide bond formation protein DsbA n=1 Tax=Chitinophaga caeni TaxID=2029983 RepID=A0A291QXJ4_9BACT|nr:thioredoxin domain-containing protein [Chitinophaga caeni]ATL48668.1 disulfide bond formation protein DsbA [Chitinophaga caeni]
MANLTPAVSAKDHQQGNPNAAVTLVEYGDYQCPYCGEAYPVIKQLQQAFGDRLLFVFRNFPLSSAHQYAVAAAMAAETAAKQGAFWEMHDIIYENQAALSREVLFTFANEIGLDMQSFEDDLLDTRLAKQIEADFESGVRSGVNGTPTFFINGQRFDGDYDYESLSAAIQEIAG